MATSGEKERSVSRLVSACDFALAGRPVLALTVAWLTTAGHTMNFREMATAHGWVPAQGYSLHTAYLVAIALALLTGPFVACRLSARILAQSGLVLLAAGSFFNGILIDAPFWAFMVARVTAGLGAGLVVGFAPRLLDRRWENPTTWASILLPVAGSAAISAPTMFLETSDWPSGFLAVGGAAALALAVLMSIAELPERSPATPPRGSAAHLPFLAIGSAAMVYVLHWGQLHGWFESIDIVAGCLVAGVAWALAILIVFPRLDFLALSESWIRLLLIFFGGFCQFFHGTSMNIYGGLLLNFSSWQRSLLIWSLPLGVATSLVTARTIRRRWKVAPALPGAITGLLMLALGMFVAHERTVDWPYWQVTNVIDLNWFQAPQHWELAPARYLIGLGIGLFMISMDTMNSPDVDREEKVRPLLLVTQFYGGGIGIAVLVNCFLIGHPIQYSYTADRDLIQAEEIMQRKAVLQDALSQAGDPAAERKSEALLFRMVNYEADNLIFAEIYAAFAAAALGLAALCLVLLIQRRLQPVRATDAP
jgi:hypothetical protein